MRGVISILIMLAFASCSTTKQMVTDNRAENHSEREVIKRRDSIYLYEHDSIFMLVKGDTVFIEKYHTLYKYRDLLRVDTVTKTDSISVNKEVVKIVEPSKWQVFWQMFGKISASVLILALIILVVKKKLSPILKLWTKSK